MTGALFDYFSALGDEIGGGWNRFWFRPIDPVGVALLRILVGGMAVWFLVGFTFDLTTWFAADGLIPPDLVRQLSDPGDGRWNGRLSILNWSDDLGFLWFVHAVGGLLAVGFAIGFKPLITGPALLAIVLSYVHRGPLIMGPFEAVLTWLLCYVCWTPCGERLSAVQWWLDRTGKRKKTADDVANRQYSVAANIGLRLVQVHTAALYGTIALTKLAGDVWWNGEAMWWLIAHPESRLVDLTILHRHEFLIDFWTHSAVAFELAFPILIWHSKARPLLLGLAIVHWSLMGVITGQVSYAAIMVIASLSFLPIDWQLRARSVASHSVTV